MIRDLVLVGGGHAHVQVLRRLAMRPVPGLRLSVVVDTPIAVYSGMVPGVVAGQYAPHEVEIDVRPLAHRARARVIPARAVGVDAAAGRLRLDGRPGIAYDGVSFDIGSTVRGLDLPGVADHAIATRPIGKLVARLDPWITRLRSQPSRHVVVVGGGAGGVEMAFALRTRLGGAGAGAEDCRVTLLEAGARVLPGGGARATRRVEAALGARGIAVRTGVRVAAVEAHRVHLEGGEEIDCDGTLWVAGAASQPWLAESGLPVDAAGFVRIRPTLQVEGHDAIFAVGDCASFEPPLPKAGVYAVRQGPVLADNLRAFATGGRLRGYRPQRDFLSLLNLADGSAVASKWGLALEGPAAFQLKDWIDRRFVRRFQVLAVDGERSADFPEMPGMSAEDMPCGGCAAKVGESVLGRALGRLTPVRDDAVILGLASPDDAAAVETPGGELVVASIDAFRAFSGDEHLVGEVCAANAASDLWAKGVAPRFALAHVTVPRDEPDGGEEVLYQVLAGARAFLDAEDTTLVGGHTTVGEELAVGFAVWGTAEQGRLLRLGGLLPGDRLVLTKPLGTGVLLAADMRGLARSAWIDVAHASMRRSNRAAALVALKMEATASTDVSGFGLAGHLGEMLRASKVAARISLGALPLLPGVAELLAGGLRSSFHPENARARHALRIAAPAVSDPRLDAIFDPQTSGGLLFGVGEARVAETVAALASAGCDAADIGQVAPASPETGLFEVGQ